MIGLGLAMAIEKFGKAGKTGRGWFDLARQAHLRLGWRGERLAAALMIELGFTVLTRNYCGRHGEIDLVVRNLQASRLSFIEVKTRSRAGRARPGAAVGPIKQGRIIRTAHRYLRELGYPAVAYSFDVVEVIMDERSLQALHYWPGAFTEEPSRARFEQRFPDMPAEYVRIL